MTWQEDLQQLVTDGRALCRQLQLDPKQLDIDPTTPFPVRVPQSFIDRMQVGDASDPLLRQVLAVNTEQQIMPGFHKDPLQEQASMPMPGLLHKYHGRVLLMVAGACAVHCRYCFRRHFPYQQAALAQRDWARWWRYIQDDTSIKEVILSGGDPLMLTDGVLAKCLQAISSISHVQRIRIHTRLPVVIPDRLTDQLLALCQQYQLLLVLHCNHANELKDDLLAQRLTEFRQRGVQVFNQSVLLAGINDTASAQVSLSKALWSLGVLPYYLHVLDPVAGAAHFATIDQRAVEIHAAMQRALPGYLVPKLVREQADMPHKVLLHA